MGEKFSAVKAASSVEFNRFVKQVTPANEIHQVWLAEAIMILQILWEIFKMLERLGFFSRFFATLRVKRAMRKKGAAKEAALALIKAELAQD